MDEYFNEDYFRSMIAATTPFQKCIPLAFHATTVTSVDDHDLFLQAFEMFLLDVRHIESFSDVMAAEQTLLIRQDIQSIKPPLDFSRNKLLTYLSNIKRFEQVAIIVCDYYMPMKKGSDFFSELRKKLNYPFKSVLLTGMTQTDLVEQLTGEASIDQMILKTEVTGDVTALLKILAGLERAYFEDAMDVSGQYPILKDPGYITLVNKLLLDNQIVEGCLLDGRGSYLMANNDGELWQLSMGETESPEEHDFAPVDDHEIKSAYRGYQEFLYEI